MKKIFALLLLAVSSLGLSFHSSGKMESVRAFEADSTKVFGGKETMFVNDTASAFDVSLLNKGEFAVGKKLNKDYMLSLSLDRMMVNFRKIAGIPTSFKEYGGWHAASVGAGSGAEPVLLSALSYLYAEEKDPLVLERINNYVDAFAECQNEYAKNHPAEAGYLAAFPISELYSLESYGTAFWPIMYNYAKYLEGYYSAFYYAKSQKAYDIWVNLGTFLAERTVSYDENTRQRVFAKEVGDISIAFFRLYLVTGREVFKEAAFIYCNKSIFAKLKENVDPFSYLHCNTNIPVVRSAIFAYLATGDTQYLTMAKNGFSLMTKHRAFANGNTSETEDLHPEHETDTEGFMSAETCCAYNYMKVCDLLYRITNDKYYMDYYENLLYNQILSSIDWDTGMKTYYISMDNGYHKVYHTPEDSFWCCTVTGWESFSRFNQNIYYTKGDALIVNLFINSEIRDSKTGLGLRQEHDFPNKSVVDFVVTKAANTTLKVRNPSWVEGKAQVSLNGQLIDYAIGEDGYINIKREFLVGDNIKIHFPMGFRLSRLDSVTEPHSDAIMYGPIMMVGVIEGIGDISPILPDSFIGQSHENKIKKELFYAGQSLFEKARKVDDLKYVIKADNQEVLVKAFFKCYRERYIVYWDIYKIGSDEYKEFIADSSLKESKIIDRVITGNYFSEFPHDFENNGKTWIGNCYTEKNRGLTLDGYAAYTLKVQPDIPNVLAIKHFGRDSGYSYAVYFNDEKKYDVDVVGEGDHFYWKTFAIPMKYTSSKNSVKVKIECTKGVLTTGLYAIETRRSDLPSFLDESVVMAQKETRVFEAKDYLLDKIKLNGVGSLKLYGTRNEEDYELIYEGNANVTITRYQQFKKIKVLAVSEASFNLEVSGAEVTRVDPISHTVANEDMYYPERFANVHLKGFGTVKLRIDWASVGLKKGQQEGFAPLFDTSLKVQYSINCKSLDEGLLLYYDMENVDDAGNILDASGHGHNAKAEGRFLEGKGRYGKGIDLGGQSYLELPTITGISNEMTLSIWAKYNSSTDVLFQRLFDLGNDDSEYLTTTFGGYAYGKSASGSSMVTQEIFAVKEDKWYNIVLTVDANKKAITFVNGIEVSRNEKFAFDLSLVSSFLKNYIGKSHVEFTPYLDATIDEVRIYDYALSKEQVTGLSQVKNPSLKQFASTDISLKEAPEEVVDITYDKGSTLTPIVPKDPKATKDNTALVAIGVSVGTLAIAGAITAPIVVMKRHKKRK